MNETTPPGYRAIAEMLERIDHRQKTMDDRQQTMGAQISAIDGALRGNLEHNELGLIARVDIVENTVVRMQQEQGRLAAEVARPGDERRQDARAIVTGGLAAVFGSIITWVAVHFVGKGGP